MIKIIEINISEILLDEAACSEIINRACSRHSSWRVTGICADDSIVFIVVEDAPGLKVKNYRLAPLAGENKEEIAAEIKSRYDCGFTTTGSFMTCNGRYALFAEVDLKQEQETE
ncbi:hypothetical protein P0136_02720 [Lentisphaerota bacterium ZTH]|nr:hypothetical protein JYG24_06140 [Lentisphaerota bacterium]WET06915.1 hypothetical protein P0136_02720 [Lentisphaerota bacterium ZTH]